MLAELLSRRPHTHNALDDAVEQGELFQNLMTWNGRSRQHPDRHSDRAIHAEVGMGGTHVKDPSRGRLIRVY